MPRTNFVPESSPPLLPQSGLIGRVSGLGQRGSVGRIKCAQRPSSGVESRKTMQMLIRFLLAGTRGRQWWATWRCQRKLINHEVVAV